MNRQWMKDNKDGLMLIAFIVTVFVVAMIFVYMVIAFVPSQYETNLTEIAHCEESEQFTQDQCIMIVGGRH